MGDYSSKTLRIRSRFYVRFFSQRIDRIFFTLVVVTAALGLHGANSVNTNAVGPCSRWGTKIHNDFSDCLYHIPHRFFKFGFGLGGAINGSDVITALEGICASAPTVDYCMEAKLRPCGRDVLGVYRAVRGRSFSFCNGDGRVTARLATALADAGSVDDDVITNCRTRHRRMQACRRQAQENALRNRKRLNFQSATLDPYVQTGFLLDVLLCQQDLYAEVCPRQALLLTLLHNQNELAPPRLGANVSHVLSHLSRRQGFYNLLALTATL